MSHIRKVVDTTRGLILLLGAIGITLALVVAALTVALEAQTKATHAQAQAKDAANRATAVALEQAREAKTAAQRAQESIARIQPAVCGLVYTYENLGQPSANKRQVSSAWRLVGGLVFCPDGIKPPVDPAT